VIPVATCRLVRQRPRAGRWPHEGSGSFLAGKDTIEASGGSVVVVPAGEVHGFTASFTGPLRMTCLHLHDRMIPEWVDPG